MKNERLNAKSEEIISESVDGLMEWLINNTPEIDGYTQLNLGLNILVGAIVRISYSSVAKEHRKCFLVNLAKTLDQNFKANDELSQ